MKNSLVVVLLGLILPLLLVQGCETNGSDSNNDPSEVASKLVMADDSELAVLMRDLTTETAAIKSALENGEQHPVWNRVAELHTANPTDAGSSGPAFEGFSDAFIYAVKKFEASDSLKVKHFNAVVNRCMDCHFTFCPGPIKRIEKLLINQ